MHDIRQWKLMHVNEWKEDEIGNIKEIEERSGVIVLFRIIRKTSYYMYNSRMAKYNASILI